MSSLLVAEIEHERRKDPSTVAVASARGDRGALLRDGDVLPIDRVRAANRYWLRHVGGDGLDRLLEQTL